MAEIENSIPAGVDAKIALEYWDPKDLIPYENNSRTHSESQVEKIAASMSEFGFVSPILVDRESKVIIAGHGRLMAAEKLRLQEVPVLIADHLNENQKRAFVIADNKLAQEAGWNYDQLASELDQLEKEGFAFELTGFDIEDLDKMLAGEFQEFHHNSDAGYAESQGEGFNDQPRHSDQEQTPEASNGFDEANEEEFQDEDAPVVSQEGDVWVLGDHRVMCGSSTNPEHVEKLVKGQTADLLHSDPPYGMGKQSEGVANDNIYRDELVKFQMDWIKAFRPHLTHRASVYIWGNDEELWRLWYGGLSDSEKEIHFQNCIRWVKPSAQGMSSPEFIKYATNGESCLFYKYGKQFIGSLNSVDFPEEYQEILDILLGMAEDCALNYSKTLEICGNQMWKHWFTTSQFSFIPEKHYLKLQGTYPESFTRDWAELNDIYQTAKQKVDFKLKDKLNGMRSYFDNTHDNMHDIWEFPIVIGEERHGHATPKPVAMMQRVMKSSLPPGGLCFEPFGGSGSTLMGAESTGRRCYTMELQPKYVDTIVRRWQNWTEQDAILEESGETFAEIEEELA